MPVQRIVLAGDERLRIECVQAPAHGDDWGPIHHAPNWRWVLPGSGGVHWRSGDERLLVDELTAFHLRPGDPYQLQHERGRRHMVVSRDVPPVRGTPARAWLVQPGQLFQLQLAWRALQRGAAPAAVVATVDGVLARSRPLPSAASPAALARARRFIAGEPGVNHPLQAIGEAARCSPFHLARLFGRHLGTTPHQYRLSLRLAAALGHLAAGERDLAGLAHDLGFCSQSHFGAAFRRAVGVPPARARDLLAGAGI